MTDRDPATTLTPAEHEAWTLANRGLSQRAIALALGISRSSVRARLENATRKLNAEPVILRGVDITELVARTPGRKDTA